MSAPVLDTEVSESHLGQGSLASKGPTQAQSIRVDRRACQDQVLCAWHCISSLQQPHGIHVVAPIFKGGNRGQSDGVICPRQEAGAGPQIWGDSSRCPARCRGDTFSWFCTTQKQQPREARRSSRPPGSMVTRTWVPGSLSPGSFPNTILETSKKVYTFVEPAFIYRNRTGRAELYKSPDNMYV